MGDETSDTMNLDLNLGPDPESQPNETINLDAWIGDPIDRIREAVRLRSRRWRWMQVPHETRNNSLELSQLMGSHANVSTLQAGEGSVAAEERTIEIPKTCENNNGFLEDEVSDKKEDVEKTAGSDGSFFDCNICLDLARDPVVTCCGHLFCWSCLYRWLHVHSDAKECPVCKGEVTSKNITPIYGRGNGARGLEEDSSLEIPVRPTARRVESWRQTAPRNPYSFPVDEMIRRLGSRFDLTRDMSPPQDGNSNRETAERTLLHRLLTSRGMREQNSVSAPPDDIDTIHSDSNGPEGEARRLHSLLMRRQLQSPNRPTAISSISSDRLVEAYFRNHPRSQEQPSPPVDDRDSVSSIAAVINSESQMDTAVEIDSMVSLSTSSSRRRSDNSRVSDDSGDSRAPRRRRLN